MAHAFFARGHQSNPRQKPGEQPYPRCRESPEANGISGNNIVGYYYTGSLFSEAAHGFVYDIYTSGYDTFNVPGALNTYAEGVDGNDVVGYYQGAGGIDYGFVASSVPEPSDFGLLAAGAMAIVAGRVRKLPVK